MTQFRQFLTEQDDLLKNASELIKQHCQPFLALSDGKALFRSVSRPVEKALIIPHPKYRPPRDSSQEFSFAFNAAIDAAYGIPDIRQRSFFAVGSLTEASKYAKHLAFCFPCGNFQWAWSKKLQDSYVGEDGGLEFFAESIRDLLPRSKFPITAFELIEFFENLFTIIGSVSSAVWVHNLDGNAEQHTEAAARKCSDRNILKLKHADLIKAIKLFALDYYKNNESFAEAITSRNEIFFYDSDGYILVPFHLIAKSGVPVTTAYSSFLDSLN
jgi:hypothetical protein